LVKKEVVVESVQIENEWGITIDEEADESQAGSKTVEQTTFSLDDLKNQLGGLYKKK
jgi:hypothetical protein